MIGQAIEYLLKNDPTVSEMIGARVFANPAREEIKPYPRVVYEVENTKDDGDESHTFDGTVGLAKETVTISCLARTRVDASRLAVKVRGRLEGYSGTVEGLDIQGTFVDGWRDHEFWNNPQDQDFVIFSRDLSVEFVFLEPAPEDA